MCLRNTTNVVVNGFKECCLFNFSSQGPLLKPHVAVLVPTLLEALSSLETQVQLVYRICSNLSDSKNYYFGNCPGIIGTDLYSTREMCVEQACSCMRGSSSLIVQCSTEQLH